METIKNYIESMFRNLPQTEKVLRAKSELYQMMEDKYTELIREGKSENEAVGTVISEFGNLEEISDDLGFSEIFKTTRQEKINRRKLSFDDVKGYITTKKLNAQLIGAGVFCCICCVTGPILSNVLDFHSTIGVSILFIILTLGISCFIIAGGKMDTYRFIHEENCSIDAAETEYVHNKRREYSNKHSILLSIGIMLCFLSVVPPIIFDDLGLMEDLSVVFLFLFVGAGVYLITSSSIMKKSYDTLLGLNSESEKSKMNNENVKYSNKTVKVIMSVYWQTMTCIYLCFSFITHAWHLSWLIWPIAAVINGILKANYTQENE